MSTASNNIRYFFFSLVYDRALQWFYRPLIARLIGEVNAQPAGQVLEIGVGTGLSLPFYRQPHVTAIDCSAPMLSAARRKANALPDLQLELVHASAEDYSPQAHRYRHIVFCNTLSVVADPAAVFRAYYVALPAGGNIYILNHFTPERGVLRILDRLLKPLGNVLGFKSYFPLSSLVGPDALAQARTVLSGYWGIVHIQKLPYASA
ncbi:class I SAM-dependent methyltransferase [Hymenobacter busanensis]|uniref:Class I SAM-dependent methyltransferase n=1 Tax=Hymenobacter busanensis TaxID=2607656 RepID=A0A7L5A0I7_9BACT|nr:class I SAM-dependent methyltransferase [Hymenobacter busanensis]KAA9338521.1 class I SAM-dependent methyltransferase [Hymenobacter busanensis]QHJ09051.1 methyltransferase domain-containing protein [Hymenobacter busanensis]